MQIGTRQICILGMRAHLKYHKPNDRLVPILPQSVKFAGGGVHANVHHPDQQRDEGRVHVQNGVLQNMQRSGSGSYLRAYDEVCAYTLLGSHTLNPTSKLYLVNQFKLRMMSDGIAL